MFAKGTPARDQMLARCRRLIARASEGAEANQRSLRILRPLNITFNVITTVLTFLATAYILSSDTATAAKLAIAAGLSGTLQAVLSFGPKETAKQTALKLQKIALETATRIEDFLVALNRDLQRAEENGIRDRIASISEFLSAVEEG